jgi:glutaminase
MDLERILNVHKFIYFASVGNLQELQIQHILEKMDVNSTNYDGRTALHLASEEGHEVCVAYLLEQPDIQVNCLDRWMNTPLSGALKYGRVKISAMLKDKGAKVHLEEEIHTKSILHDHVDPCKKLFSSLATNGILQKVTLEDYLVSIGYDLSRNNVMSDLLKSMFEKESINWEDMKRSVVGKKNAMYRALHSDFAIHDWSTFTSKIKKIFDQVNSLANLEGKVAYYIQKYNDVDSNNFVVSICTVDGQSVTFGESKSNFTIQSCMKPILYSIAIEELGEQEVHKYVGKEPSGAKYNSICVNDEKKPHNPLINSGGIVVCSLYHPKDQDSKRFKLAMEKTADFCGGSVGFQNEIYLSERETSDINRSLSYFLAARSCFPKGTDIEQTLDFYLQCCCIEVNNDQLATVASTLANYGQNPLTGKKCVSPSSAIRCMQLMYTCGMAEYSGEWSCQVGLPAKAGISGGLFICVPGICGISIFSPFVDKSGISVKGKEFAKLLEENFPHWNLFGLLEKTSENTEVGLNGWV